MSEIMEAAHFHMLRRLVAHNFAYLPLWNVANSESQGPQNVSSLFLKCRATHHLHLGSTSTTSHHDLRHNETRPELHRVHSLLVCVCPSQQHKQIYKPMANWLRRWHYLPD
jgi:hypothetical protein